MRSRALRSREHSNRMGTGDGAESESSPGKRLVSFGNFRMTTASLYGTIFVQFVQKTLTVRGSTMKTVISISEARKQLPGIIKKLRQSPDTVYQVTVHDEVVAEIKTAPRVKPGEAAKQLLALRKRTATKRKSKKYPLSENIKELLYVAEDQ